MTNPLIENEVLPSFEAIQPEHVEPAIKGHIESNLNELDNLLKSKAHSWDALMGPLELLQNRLQKAWSPVSHLNSVVNTTALREAYNACLPKLTDYYTEFGQNRALYERVQALHDSPEFADLNQAQQQVIKHTLRDFKLSGIALNDAKQKQYAEIQQKLSKLQTKFSENILDATDNWRLDITDEKQAAGLPKDAIAMAQAKAKSANISGMRFGLDAPSYIAIMTHCEDRNIREQMYRAYTTRASDQGPLAKKYDNSQLMEEIVGLRHQLAQLLDFEDYAALSLATKMAETPAQIMTFLQDLAKKTKPVAEKQYHELQQFAEQETGMTELKPWDLAFYSEKLKNKQFNISQEMLKPYFPLPKVMQGMFEIVSKLYGIHFEEVTDFSSWHPEVKFYKVFDEKKTLRGMFYMDLFARAQKRNGAWMDECRVRFKPNGSIQHPVAYLVCNFMPPSENKPALLTHDEVETLFHEFGHTLHHILTLVDYMDVSGINGVPWDAVELPSQFLENWCWQPEAIKLISSHFETGEPLPQDLLNKLLAAKNFQSGMQLIRQLEFALFDFKLHHEYQPERGEQVSQCLKTVRDTVTVVPVPDFNRFQHSFSHIFAGGYAAGYYSYLWAEVLACDAFSRFEEEGVLNPKTGRSFLHNILEQGGSDEPSVLFEAFRGRAPSIEPLLRHRGICS